MAQSTVFTSSCSRRELARRRPGRSPHLVRLLLVALVVAICVAAFVLWGGGI
ncbi:MAG: hypothetical protein ACLP50_33000 [Solirubrobacteraceae bacterium]